ncbi:MAG: hypothetical protein QM730_08770 [Anaerolineales bacterium]
MNFFACAALFLMVLSGCSSASATPTLPPESMKGYELYSWESEGTWYFSLLVGTNRLNTVEEIQHPATVLKDIDGLKPVLESLGSGQYVSWTANTPLAFPPEEIVQQVQQICQTQGLELFVAQ